MNTYSAGIVIKLTFSESWEAALLKHLDLKYIGMAVYMTDMQNQIGAMSAANVLQNRTRQKHSDSPW